MLRGKSLPLLSLQGPQEPGDTRHQGLRQELLTGREGVHPPLPPFSFWSPGISDEEGNQTGVTPQTLRNKADFTVTVSTCPHVAAFSIPFKKCLNIPGCTFSRERRAR